ncbi:molybdenum cofactor biosynthesis prote [Coprinopsis marcescibilis]|uniref:Molybdenum cofactor biosynthesis prote n=1 Tax=Coprinopsis marcescibilis TaxID=230819 RepID=A0A5C3LGC2_COPMA|nr:molybdenum cofactor biosynthesis prote [Coprinopsis marcescibilis]
MNVLSRLQLTRVSSGAVGVRRLIPIGTAPNSSLSAKTRIAEVDAASPHPVFLVDTFKRRHDYLRISLTERCNLRCFYCMPGEGIQLSPPAHILTNDEILRLASIFIKNGVSKIRLTGGEPTIRKGIMDLIQRLNEMKLMGLQSIAMTSNGLVLHRHLPQLVENGLTHLNLSLDTLDPLKFELITRRRGHEAVMKTLDMALQSGLKSVKLNVVVIKGLNDSEVLDFVAMTEDKPISVRFIEFMPFTGNKWDSRKMVPSAELLNNIRVRHPTVVRALIEPNETARTWVIPGFKGSFGFISSMSDHFCSSCNRLRLTADGQIKVCLFDPNEVSLRDSMRRGATDEQLLNTISSALSNKKEKHAGMNDIDVVLNRPMILIGNFGIKIRKQRPLRRYFSTGPQLTHINKSGRANMVDVGSKQPTRRSATATGSIYTTALAYKLVTQGYPAEDRMDNPRAGIDAAQHKAMSKASRKGDVLVVSQIAAIMAAKQTSSLIPLCHPLSLSKIDVELMPRVERDKDGREKYIIQCTATVACEGKTGVEMEALTAVSAGLLTVWDMLKAVAGKEMEIGQIKVISKTGGVSGDFQRDTD